MKKLLLSDINLEFCCADEFIDTSIFSLEGVLNELLESAADLLIIYAELKFAEGERQYYQGIELLKHIRLTPELDNINKKPIVLLHWMDIEYYIERNKENIILFSPNIYRKRLPICKFQTSDFPVLNNIHLKEYIIDSEHDMQISEHNFRNKIAIEQFRQQSLTNSSKSIDKPLWFKKLYYKYGYFSQPVNSEISQLDQQLKILLIDDLGDEWKDGLLKVLPKADITFCKSVDEGKKMIKELQKKVQERRYKFKKTAMELNAVYIEMIEKIENQKIALHSVQNIKSNINASISDLSKDEKLFSEKTKQLKVLLKELSLSGGLLEILIDANTESINSNSKKSAIILSELISSISNLKENIIKIEGVKKEQEEKLFDSEKKEKRLMEECKRLKSEYLTESDRASNAIEALVKSEYDLVLIDMHFSKESESKQPNEMDGFDMLQAIQDSGLKLPSAIFSATTKNIEVLKDTFKFLIKNQYIKGITPVRNFIEITNQLKAGSQINRLVNIIDEIMVYPNFKGRHYKFADSSEYESTNLVEDRRNSIINELKVAKESILAYYNDGNRKQIENACKNLGIIKEARLNSKDKRGESIYYQPNAVRNKIGKQELELNEMRNIINHDHSNSKEKIKFEEWFTKLDLDEFEKHLKVTFNKLIFDL